MNTPAYLERVRKRRTTPKDIRQVTETYSFTADEMAFINKLCTKIVVPNITYLLANIASAYDFCKSSYQFLASGGFGAKEDVDYYNALLLSVWDKVSKQFQFTSAIASSYVIPVGQAFFYVDNNGRKHACELVNNDSTGMILTVPLDNEQNELRPPELQSINLFFVGAGDIGYTTAVRVVRYQERAKRREMAVSHTSYFLPHLRHEYTYIRAQCSCVCTVSGADGGTGQLEGMLVNYSGINCNIVLPEPLGVGQQFVVDITLTDTPDKITMSVANVAIMSGGKYLVHANYVAMAQKTKNYILARTNAFI
jgi:hypothetical protein